MKLNRCQALRARPHSLPIKTPKRASNAQTKHLYRHFIQISLYYIMKRLRGLKTAPRCVRKPTTGPKSNFSEVKPPKEPRQGTAPGNRWASEFRARQNEKIQQFRNHRIELEHCIGCESY